MTRQEFATASRGLTGHITSEGQHISEPAWRAIWKVYNSRKADDIATGVERHRDFAKWLWGEKEPALRRLIAKETRLHRIATAAGKIGAARKALQEAQNELQEARR